jgi:4-aminobutyrate aminotransferase/(S)-3-amino-2-methylpropionate transaminase
MTATGAAYRQNFGPFAADVHHVPYPDPYHGVSVADALTAIDELIATRVPADQIAAIIIEPQLGEGGFLPAPPEFLRALRALATRHGIVLVLDEIQSGFGRTGRMWGFEHAGIEPDLVTVAKSLAGGLPLSAVVGTASIMDAPAPGGLGGTYAGNPLACAAALAVLDIYEREDLVARAVEIGTTLRETLERLQASTPAIGDVRGLGAMLAFELVEDRESRAPDAALTQRLVARARERGLLLLTCGPHKNVVRLLPPLTVTKAELARAIEILDGCL